MINDKGEMMMINFLICLIISILLSIGISIALVEKGGDFPIRTWRIRLQLLLRKVINYKFSRVLKCTVCTSFWVSLFSDIILCIICFLKTGAFYFFWPFSGFIVLGLIWCIIEHLNAMDKK